ncbi:MAG TPA: prepilin-type N-terminal cleavage/methylation domain-containing protein [Candidatus Limnocylindrales bacterium]|nr:prepilin-type N-terminal cleavage/methylation domain-containing protein [Candidatus Limnocylindrales bacterium]
MKKRQNHRRLGFSLIEVICAISILAIAVVGLTEGITLALQSNKDSELQSTAALYAAGLIETIRAEGDFEDGDQDGDCGDDLPLYRWKESIKKAGIDGLHEVKVVIGNAKSGKTIYELETLLFQAPDDTTTSTTNPRRNDLGNRRRRS